MRELVFESERFGPDGFRQLVFEFSEGGVAVDDDDARVAADVAERFVVGAGDDVAAVAAHQPELRRG